MNLGPRRKKQVKGQLELPMSPHTYTDESGEQFHRAVHATDSQRARALAALNDNSAMPSFSSNPQSPMPTPPVSTPSEPLAHPVDLHHHFWFDLNKGKSIGVSNRTYGSRMSAPENLATGRAAKYHIQHVIRNPEIYGFNNLSEMEPHMNPNSTFDEIESGETDIDLELEHHVMKRGFARGYHIQHRNEINADVATHDHMNRFLTHILPHLNPHTKVNVDVGYRGYVRNPDGSKPPPVDNLSFKGRAAVEAHLKGIAPIAPVISVRNASRAAFDAEEARGSGGVLPYGPVRDTVLKYAPKGLSPFYIRQRVQAVRGEVSDSVNYKTSFKEFFREMMEAAKPMSASAQMRVGNTPATRARLARAGGTNTMIGTVARKAGISSARLTALEKRAEKGKKINPADAQRIVASLLNRK
jgi:hypothetical protein